MILARRASKLLGGAYLAKYIPTRTCSLTFPRACVKPLWNGNLYSFATTHLTLTVSRNEHLRTAYRQEGYKYADANLFDMVRPLSFFSGRLGHHPAARRRRSNPLNQTTDMLRMVLPT